MYKTQKELCDTQHYLQIVIIMHHTVLLNDYKIFINVIECCCVLLSLPIVKSRDPGS